MFEKIAIGVFVAIFLVFVVYTIMRNRKIMKNGIETEAVISRIKEEESTDSDGNITTDYIYYVNYQNEKGEIVEARLSNPPKFAVEGTQMHIKYLPEKPKLAIRVKE